MDDAQTLPARSLIVQEHLHAAGLAVPIRVLPDSASTAAAAAAAIGCAVGAIANSLVLLADGEPLLAMTSGGHRVDMEVLAASIGAVSVRMAPAAVVRESTGQAIGGVAPVGHPERLRAVIDAALEQYDEIWTAAGHPHTVMPLTFQALRRLTGGDVVAVC